MDSLKWIKIVSCRIQEIEPEHASKIVQYLDQFYGEHDMIRLAFLPDNVIKTVTEKIKDILGLSFPQHQVVYPPLNTPPTHHQFNSYPTRSSHSRSFSSSQLCLPPYPHLNVGWNGGQAYSETIPEGYGLETQFQQSLNINVDDHLDSEICGNSYYPKPGLDGLGMGRGSRRSQSLSDFPPKVCHYFSKGFCKHGTNCRYVHVNPHSSESFSKMFGLYSNENGNGNVNRNGNGDGNDDHNVLSLMSLEKLEMEITELLRSRKGSPVSIASLPMLYYEKYGRTLQAEGYLTESQRHGKVGYSLTKLLARLKKSVRVIDRPHGQHAVILAEDFSKYFDGGIVPGSRQIYLTFPPESAFTETDVSNYFSTYGPVQEVRIPCLQKRMFGFVTFFFPETVRKILAKGNPHFVCGARVLVKPYRERSRLIDRKRRENLQQSGHYNSSVLDGEFNFQSVPTTCDMSRLVKAHLMEKLRHSEMQLLSNPSVVPFQYFTNSNHDEFRFGQEFPTSKPFDLGLDIQDNTPSSDEYLSNGTTSSSDQEESDQGLNLPDSPFATSVAKSNNI